MSDRSKAPDLLCVGSVPTATRPKEPAESSSRDRNVAGARVAASASVRRRQSCEREPAYMAVRDRVHAEALAVRRAAAGEGGDASSKARRRHPTFGP